eukprot:CAMPEP_0178404456 /NCGR_PEP_ID=MMETSP0689_2-20121128/17895_1 /TAXON_ID=160604 /ORGANISM="Amphidinium massartii, Strain CS-259" /LENGTH=955 /DNA_ID=CAMNT_0020025445 /DNA_START=98 /DNA_END=2961 /DNA_ORIENTATION=+
MALVLLPLHSDRRSSKPSSTLQSARATHSGFKSLPSLAIGSPREERGHGHARKSKVRHNTFWHWQPQASGVVLVPTGTGAPKASSGRASPENHDKGSVQLPKIVSAMKKSSSCSAELTPSSASSHKVRDEKRPPVQKRKQRLDDMSLRYCALAAAASERAASKREMGQRPSDGQISNTSEASSLEGWQRAYIQQQIDQNFWKNTPTYPDSESPSPSASPVRKRGFSQAAFNVKVTEEETEADLKAEEQRANEEAARSPVGSMSLKELRMSSKSGSLASKSGSVALASLSPRSHASTREFSGSMSARRKPSKEQRLWRAILPFDPSLHETLDPDLLSAVFLELQDPVDHLLLCEWVPKAMTKLGYEDIDLAWVEEITTALVADCSFLEQVDFELTMQRYRDRRLNTLCQEFKSYWDEASQTMSFESVVLLLAEQDIITVRGMVQELLKEINGTASKVVTPQDYVRIRELVQYRGGFTTKEVDEARALFNRYDANRNGSMDTKELETALKWLGFSVQSDAEREKPRSTEVSALLEKAKVTSDSITFKDFLHVMRRHREAEIISAKDDFTEKFGEAGEVDVDGAVKFIHHLGYSTACQALVEEICDDVGIAYKGGLYFCDVYMIYHEARMTEGFMKGEIDEFKSAFETYDTNHSGAVDVVELGGVLRWLGYHVTVEMQQDLLDDVDIDKSGELDFDEFLKILRWYREEELRQLEQAFATGDEDGNGRLDSNEVSCLLACLGFFPLSPDQAILVEQITKETQVDFRECSDMIDKLRLIARDHFRNTHGFEGEELATLRKEFEACDKDGNGYIAQREIVFLFEKYCPATVPPQQARKVFTDMLSQVDEDGDGRFDIGEFLHLMRLLQDRADYDLVLEEQEAATKAGFSREETKDMRKIFKLCDSDASRALEVDELLKALTSVVKMSFSMKEQVKKIFKEVDTDGSRSLDFSEFLLVMRRV